MDKVVFDIELNTILQKNNIGSLIECANNKITNLLQDIGPYFVLFGAGRLGMYVLDRLRSIGLEPIAFVDNNPKLWGKTLKQLIVLSPNDAYKKLANSAIFIVTIYTNNSVNNQLKALGIIPVTFPELAWNYPQTFLPHACLEYPATIFQQVDEVTKCLSLWSDKQSAKEFVAQILWRTTLDSSILPAHLPPEEIYFPTELITLQPSEVFVDCGAFNGDSIREFLRNSGNSFKEIIGIEPDPDNFQELQQYFSTTLNSMDGKVIGHHVAIGSSRQKVQFNATGTAGSALGTGSYTVESLPLDELLTNSTPTYIKMDIEGAELDALMGSRQVISRCLPVLAICLYHKQEHLWKIPLLIQSISSQYHLFLRRYSDECWELVCYAIPECRLRK